MRILWTTLALAATLPLYGATYTEFYCDPVSGDNRNAGSSTGAHLVEYTNGQWQTGQNISGGADGNLAWFDPAGAADPSAAGIVVGDWVSLYNDGATVSAAIARVTAVNATRVEVSQLVGAGAFPTSSATARTLRARGAWKGPNGTDLFPLHTATFNGVGGLRNIAGDTTRINLKNNASYTPTAAIVHSLSANYTFVLQGYTNAPGDGGRAVISGSGIGTSVTVYTTSGAAGASWLEDLEFVGNGSSGTAAGVSNSALRSGMRHCVIRDMRGSGLTVGGSGPTIECECYNNNLSNTASQAAFVVNAAGPMIRCIAHDNPGSNTQGFRCIANGATFAGCIADTNGADGFMHSAGGAFLNCVAYNNGDNGFELPSGVGIATLLQNSIAAKNTGWGIQASTANRVAVVANVAYGQGTMANVVGFSSYATPDVATESGLIALPADYDTFRDAPNGDFRLKNASPLINAGVGTFFQTAPGYGGTSGTPDVNAAQYPWAAPWRHQDDGQDLLLSRN